MELTTNGCDCFSLGWDWRNEDATTGSARVGCRRSRSTGVGVIAGRRETASAAGVGERSTTTRMNSSAARAVTAPAASSLKLHQ